MANTAIKVDASRSMLEWVPLEKVIPNPLNPRKNDAIRTEEMQEIILKRGWEEPLTVYKKGQIYVVMAGHRRLYAAREANIKQVPVYIVETPVNHQEEIERIASLQRGRVDWTPYEWAKFTFERWIAWGKPSIAEFAKSININAGMVKAYLTVLEYYPRFEIEYKLENGTYSIATLESLVWWMKKTKQHKEEIVESMTEEIIRKVMLNKIEKKLVTRDTLRGDKFVEISSEDDFKTFLTSSTMTLEEAQEAYGLGKKKKSFHGYLVSIGVTNKNLAELDVATESERKKAIDALKNLEMTIQSKIRTLEAKIEQDKEPKRKNAI